MGAGNYHPGKKSNNRYKLQQAWDTGPGDDLPYHLQEAYFSSLGLSLLTMEIEVNQQFYSWGAKKKLQVRKCSKKAEILYFPSYQSSSLWRKIYSSPVQSLVYLIFFSLVVTMDLSWLTKQ